MAQKFATKQVMTNGAMASTNTITTEVTVMQGLSTGAYQMVYTGTPTGAATSWTCEVSNNYDPKNPTAANWTTLTIATAPTSPAGAAGSTGLDLGTDFPWGAVRLNYINASGTGTLQCYFVGKGHS